MFRWDDQAAALAGNIVCVLADNKPELEDDFEYHVTDLIGLRAVLQGSFPKQTLKTRHGLPSNIIHTETPPRSLRKHRALELAHFNQPIIRGHKAYTWGGNQSHDDTRHIPYQPRSSSAKTRALLFIYLPPLAQEDP
eukprot:1189280-Prorocentrum_minimum.AAC.2